MSNEITRQELITKIREHARFVLVEALPPASYEAGHLPGAINLPLDAIQSSAAVLAPEKDAEIIVYCSGPTCQNSHVAARKLTSLGYERVRVFSGGKAEWTQAGHPLVTATAAPIAANG
jgi:rhodanese-related sulfurtransferase